MVREVKVATSGLTHLGCEINVMPMNLPTRMPSSRATSRSIGTTQTDVVELLRRLGDESQRRCALAEMNDLLVSLPPDELRAAVHAPPPVALSPQTANYAAAMVEYACSRAGIESPLWTATVPPLDDPVFGSTLPSLRLHLLTHSPPPFRRRNIFIDTSLGGRV